MVLLWHYIHWNVYITSIKLSSDSASLHTVICKRFRWTILPLIEMDIARGEIVNVDAIIIDNLLTSYFQSMQCNSIVRSFKITLQLLNLLYSIERCIWRLTDFFCLQFAASYSAQQYISMNSTLSPKGNTEVLLHFYMKWTVSNKDVFCGRFICFTTLSIMYLFMT